MSEKFSLKRRLLSFKYAINGIKYVLKTQHNFWIHILAAITAIILGFILNITISEWIAIIIVISLVLALEVINSAIEKIVDIVSPEIKKKAGLIKDMAAGAVLTASIGALIIGIIIFLPKIIN